GRLAVQARRRFGPCVGSEPAVVVGVPASARVPTGRGGRTVELFRPRAAASGGREGPGRSAGGAACAVPLALAPTIGGRSFSHGPRRSDTGERGSVVSSLRGGVIREGDEIRLGSRVFTVSSLAAGSVRLIDAVGERTTVPLAAVLADSTLEVLAGSRPVLWSVEALEGVPEEV